MKILNFTYFYILLLKDISTTEYETCCNTQVDITNINQINNAPAISDIRRCSSRRVALDLMITSKKSRFILWYKKNTKIFIGILLICYLLLVVGNISICWNYGGFYPLMKIDNHFITIMQKVGIFTVPLGRLLDDIVLYLYVKKTVPNKPENHFLLGIYSLLTMMYSLYLFIMVIISFISSSSFQSIIPWEVIGGIYSFNLLFTLIPFFIINE